MDYKEFEEKNGLMIGSTVWICDYRYRDIDDKPIRHVKPTQVIIVDNEELPKNKRVYYSEVHFRPLGKSGAPLKQVIAPFDNTGYRSNTGTSVNIFFTEEECNAHYAYQCGLVEAAIQGAKRARMEIYNEREKEIADLIAKYKS